MRVVVRFRPTLGPEEADPAFVADSAERSVVSTDFTHRFAFDQVFDESATQQVLYEEIGSPAVSATLQGYNATVLAYGQTGSGKTYCMFGTQFAQRSTSPRRAPRVRELEEPEQSDGTVPRAVRQIFEECGDSSSVDVDCSFFEVYCEQLRDLLQPKGTSLQVRELPHQRGLCVEGLTHKAVSSAKDAMQFLRSGLRARAAANTKLNQHSSRSHAIFTLRVHRRMSDCTRHGKLTLVDLAGSEKVQKSGSAGEMLEEAKKINSSLSALGNVIDALADRRPHVPYRDSRLTRLLEDSLGGNCRTTLLVACSPCAVHAAETLSSLRFASRAKRVCNAVRLNVVSDSATADRHLLQRISSLRKELASAHRELERRFAQTVCTGGSPAAATNSNPLSAHKPPRSPAGTEQLRWQHSSSPPPVPKSWAPNLLEARRTCFDNARETDCEEGSASTACPTQLDRSLPSESALLGPITPGRGASLRDDGNTSTHAVPSAAEAAVEHGIADHVGRSVPLLGSSRTVSTAVGSGEEVGSTAGMPLSSSSETPLSTYREATEEQISNTAPVGRKFSWLIEATAISDPVRPGVAPKDHTGHVRRLQAQLEKEQERSEALTMELDRRTQETQALQSALEEARASPTLPPSPLQSLCRLVPPEPIQMSARGLPQFGCAAVARPLRSSLSPREQKPAMYAARATSAASSRSASLSPARTRGPGQACRFAPWAQAAGWASGATMASARTRRSPSAASLRPRSQPSRRPPALSPRRCAAEAQAVIADLAACAPRPTPVGSMLTAMPAFAPMLATPVPVVAIPVSPANSPARRRAVVIADRPRPVTPRTPTGADAAVMELRTELNRWVGSVM